MAVEYIVWIDIERYDEGAPPSGVSEDVDVGLGRAGTFKTFDEAAIFALTLQAVADDRRKETSSDTTHGTTES